MRQRERLARPWFVTLTASPIIEVANQIYLEEDFPQRLKASTNHPHSLTLSVVGARPCWSSHLGNRHLSPSYAAA